MIRVFRQRFTNRFDRSRAVRDDYREVFGTEAGGRVLSEIVRNAGMHLDAFTPGDPHSTSYMVGRQSVAKSILRAMDITDDELRRLIRENAYDVKADDSP